MSTSTRSKLPVLGVVVALVGIAAGVALWFLASSRLADAAKSLAPAPVDCDTALDFDEAGTYLIFAETQGEVGALDGDCANDGRSYEGSDTNLDITLFDDEEAEVSLQRDRDTSYDAGGRAGESLYSVEIAEAGEYTLRVQGDDPDVVARVGKDPSEGVGLMRALAIVALTAGVLLGVLLVVLGRRRRGDAGTAPAGWEPSYAPGAPPYQPAPAQPGYRPPGPTWGAPPASSPPQQPGWGGSRPGSHEPPAPPPSDWGPPSA